ncbi:MAG TPA: hypothetical protein VFJ98_03195 [Mycobacteriales bacterium]|nr:hypothetical protein [Mycobacteriales bacterium]
MARTAAKKSSARRPRKAAPARTARPASPASAAQANAPAPGSIDLAGGLRSLLSAVETEVREVGALSERIDKLVAELNARRDDQTKRLLALDALRASVDDASLGAFLDKAIRPRKPRVAEVIPQRLTQFR